MSRISRLQTALQNADIDAVALVPGANLTYLLGLSLHASERLAIAFCTAEGEVHVVLPALEQPRAEAEVRVPATFYPWTDAEGYQTALGKCLDVLELDGLLGVEYTAMRVLELRAIEDAYAIATVDALPVLGQLRMRKDADELAAMRRAVTAVEAGLTAAIAFIRPGVTERAVAEVWDAAMRAAGAEAPSFGTSVASGPNSANPHHSLGDRVLQAGDPVILDGGARVGHYCSDITRTVAVGEIDPELQRIYDLVLEANRAGVAAVTAGATGAQIDAAARTVITAGGYGPHFVHRTGHGLGIEVHEPPYINATETMPLPVGATFTIEPGIYLPGKGGVRIEDDVVITETGGESLTTFRRDLIHR